MQPSVVMSKRSPMTNFVVSYLVQTVTVDTLAKAMVKVAIDGNARQTFSNEAINQL